MERTILVVEEDRVSGGGRRCPEPVELILYVSAALPKSERALESIQRVLGRIGSAKVTLTVCPLPASAECVVAESAQAPVPSFPNAGARTMIRSHHES